MAKSILTVRELEVLKQALIASDYLGENELIAKIWKMQIESISADIRKIRKEQAKELKQYREAREIRKALEK